MVEYIWRQSRTKFVALGGEPRRPTTQRRRSSAMLSRLNPRRLRRGGARSLDVVGRPLRTQAELDLYGLSVELFAHDLRSPLMASRRAIIELMQGRHGVADERAPLSPSGREWHERDHLLAALNQSLERIDHLMVDILELASLPVTEMPQQRFGVRELVDMVIDQCSDPLRLTARVPSGLSVTGNRILLMRALLNLVENALRHTSGEVLVELSCVAGGLMTTVDDHGPGVPPELRDVIFEPLARLDPESSTGSGLGLTLVRRVAEAHGGMTGVETAPTGGARFVLWVPRAGDDGERGLTRRTRRREPSLALMVPWNAASGRLRRPA